MRARLRGGLPRQARLGERRQLTATSSGPSSDREIRSWTRQLGLPGIIDVHTHFLPQNVLAKVWAYFDRQGPLVGRDWPIMYRYAEEERLALLRGFGVRRFTALVYPHKPGMAQWLNAWAADFSRRVPECLRSATFFPEPSASSYVPAALAEGAQVFKAHVQVGGYDPRDPLLRPVWGALADAGVPVVVHCGSGPTPGEYTGPSVFAEVLARHPRLVAVIAHMGLPDYQQFVALAERYDNVHLDTTMAFTDFMSEEGAGWPDDLTPRLAGLQRKVLLGTDFPNIPHPYAHQLAAIARLDLGDDWLRAVCHDNAATLFSGDGNLG